MRSKQNPNVERPRELDVVTNWSLTVLLLTCLLTLGYWIIHAARVEETQLQLSETLPANYRDTIKALLASGEAPCTEVCDLTAARTAPDHTTFRVACSVSADGCRNPANYTLTLAPAAEPSR